MKRILFSFVFAASLFGAKANASYDNCLAWTTINGNSGVTLKSCTDDTGNGNGTLCTPASQLCTYASALTTACVSPAVNIGQTATGKNCCVKGCSRSEDEMTTLLQEIRASADDSLEDVFGSRTVTYFGYANTTNRSPNAGRTVSIDARLDACMGNGNVDAIQSNYSTDYDRYIACTGSGYCGDSAKNGYCSNSSNAVCLDRCACKYPGQGGTCTNL